MSNKPRGFCEPAFIERNEDSMRTKHNSLFLIVVISSILLVPDLCRSQTISEEGKSIEFTITIDSQTSCKGDAQVYSEGFGATARLSNRSNQALTLSLGAEYNRGTRAALSKEDLAAGRFEVENYGHVLPADKSGSHIFGKDPSKEKQMVLEPGQSVSLKTSFTLFVNKAEQPLISGTVGAGSHYVEVEMNIKLIGPPPTQGTDNQSGKRAKFHWVTVQSGPVLVTVPTNPTLHKCD
jgi:hypothetical protein